jgi:hypothetical protein
MLFLRSLNVLSVRFSRNKLHEIIINVHNPYVLETVDLQDEMANIQSVLSICSLEYAALVNILLIALKVTLS